MSTFNKVSKLVTLICALSTSVSGDVLLAKGRNNKPKVNIDNFNDESQIVVQGDEFNDESINSKKLKNIGENSQENSAKRSKRKKKSNKKKKSGSKNQKDKKKRNEEKNKLNDDKNILAFDGEPSESIKKTLEIVFIIDKSGSMEHLKDTTVKSFNQMLENQKNRDTQVDAYVTTVLFSTDQKIIHNHNQIKKVNAMAEEDYVPLGGTALLDAIGTAINDMSKINEKNDKEVIFFIITDGEENSSNQFELRDIKRMIEAKKELGWKFVFFGANIDSFKVAGDMGIEQSSAHNFEASDEGIEDCMSDCDNELDECM